MSTATGYFVAGSSWLHRRHPLTKLLGVALVLLAAFLLPAVVLPVMAVGLVVIAWSAGLLRPIVRAMRIPALLLTSIVVVNALFFPGATDRLLTVGPLSVTREGLTFGLVSAGRVLVAFLATVTFLFTTLADDLLEALVSRGVGHRIAFVILSAVQTVPRMQARAASILQAQQARGLPVTGSIAPSGPRPRAAHRPGDPRLARRRPRADLRAGGARVRCAAGAHRVSRRPGPAARSGRSPAAGPRLCRRRRRRRDGVGAVTTGSTADRDRRPAADRRTWQIRYPGKREPSLHGISLAVSAGERVAVAGRTGAGKSTLALAAAGFIPRVVRATVGGSVTIAGVDAKDADGSRLLGRVGIVFATPANQLSSSKLTVREELAFGLENLGVPRAEMDRPDRRGPRAPVDRRPRRP